MVCYKTPNIKKAITGMMLVGCSFSATAIASGGGILPYDRTSNLYALENGCDCVVKISPEKDITIAITKQHILYALYVAGYDYDSLSNSGIAVLPNGIIIFALSAEDDAYLMKKEPNGKLSVLFSNDTAKMLTGGEDVDFDGLVVGADGNIYVGEDEEDMILKVNPYSGYASVFIEKEDLEQLGENFDFDIQPAFSADHRYIYVASDNTPNIVFRIPYKYGKPEIFAGGPNVDPLNLSRQNYVYIVNDDYNPPLGYQRYHNERGYFSPLKPTNIKGTFTLTFKDGYDYIETAPIDWDATAHELAYIIQQALYLPVDVNGIGTIGSPWTFNNIENYELFSINDAHIYNARVEKLDEGNREDNDGSKEAIEASNHIEAIATDAYSGLITIGLNARITSGSSNGNVSEDDNNLGMISWNVGDYATDIQHKLIKYTHLSKEDVSVSGKGTHHSPWVFKFFGGFEKTKITFNVEENGYDSLSEEELLIGTMRNARAFDDPDGYMTRARSGTITLADDAGAHFIYNIDPSGRTTTLVSEWELIKSNGGPVDMEGGLAYDMFGNLFASNIDDDDNGEANIFKITPSKNISIWVTAEDITNITYGENSDVEVQGIAFEYGHRAPLRHLPRGRP